MVQYTNRDSILINTKRHQVLKVDLDITENSFNEQSREQRDSSLLYVVMHHCLTTAD